jgi:hypothetical protein
MNPLSSLLERLVKINSNSYNLWLFVEFVAKTLRCVHTIAFVGKTTL